MLQLVLNIISAVIAGIVAWCVARALRQAKRIEQATLVTNLKLDALERTTGEMAGMAVDALSEIRSSAQTILVRSQEFDARIGELSAKVEGYRKEDHDRDQKLGI